MQVTRGHAGRAGALVDLVTACFTQSEGAAEGAAVGQLIADLMTDERAELFCAEEAGQVVAVVAFSPLIYPADAGGAAGQVRLLSPMAVATPCQRRGLGQGLIRAALQDLAGRGADRVLTYGDPAYYARFGFARITTAQAAPPWPLSMAQGWQGLALAGGVWADLVGPSTCLPAFNRPDLW